MASRLRGSGSTLPLPACLRGVVCCCLAARGEAATTQSLLLRLMLPPPHVRLEDNDVSIPPGIGMLLNSVCPYDLILHPVDNGVIAVGLHQQR
ncbi:hypothetical protein SETIT_7G331200v2 [Setaria italica]|uniref:Uncharacterized protein n=2 Tax=Setaria TaxID=4554 RepID=A0A368S2H2_SETIT|nr:hypothetical protein SETIT_7G331200v2 [Setaria italica]TKW07935.1 hypothetical protein SEVIR_7G340200v2 [Setaria viridis]